ncbi:MAG: type II secretion system F family protein, partial [Anaerolineaceae bacterium]|nr:type II secretion system F family protein [Anaerolineaceae bacterium]
MNLNLLFYIAGGISIGLLIMGVILNATAERAVVDERLGRYLDDEQVNEGDSRASARTPVADWLNKRVDKSGWGDNLSKELARADVKLRSGEYIALMVIFAFLVGLVLWFLGGQSIISGLIGMIVGLFIPRIYVRREQTKRLVHFDGQLADMLNLMVNGLRAGYSTMQAMEAVSKELPSPISDEFRRVVQEMQLGIPMELALEN